MLKGWFKILTTSRMHSQTLVTTNSYCLNKNLSIEWLMTFRNTFQILKRQKEKSGMNVIDFLWNNISRIKLMKMYKVIMVLEYAQVHLSLIRLIEMNINQVNKMIKLNPLSTFYRLVPMTSCKIQTKNYKNTQLQANQKYDH